MQEVYCKRLHDLPSRYLATNRWLIIHQMNIPDRLITLTELRRNDGSRGSRKFIAHKGIVYDVTDCPKWRGDLHENLHFSAQDLTSELPDAPHKEEVFRHDCVKMVGRLEI